MHETHCAPPSRREEVPFMYLHCWKVREGTPFFGAKGRIIDRPSPLFVPSFFGSNGDYLSPAEWRGAVVSRFLNTENRVSRFI